MRIMMWLAHWRGRWHASCGEWHADRAAWELAQADAARLAYERWKRARGEGWMAILRRWLRALLRDRP